MEYILITGGSRGIGQAISIALASAGYNVLINFNADNKSAVDTQKYISNNGGIAELLSFDVSNYDETITAINEWRKTKSDSAITGLVCNAGIVRDNLLAVMSQNDWSAVINTNLTGTFNTIKAVLPQMIKAKYGRIITLSSVAGLSGGFGQTNYCASKAGIIALSKSLALEVAHKNITVNCIAPGYIKTDMLKGLKDEEIISKIPLKRLGMPDEIARAVLHFMDKNSTYSTGAVLSIDGGVSI